MTDEAQNPDSPSQNDASVVAVHFKLENTSSDVFSTYPDQAELTTSTGDTVILPQTTHKIGGVIQPGETRETDLLWFLHTGKTKDITSIKLRWRTWKGDETTFSDERKNYDIEIKLN